MQAQLVVGWKERVDFVDWDIHRVRVKMDTGARTSAIDAMIHEVRANPDGSRTALLEVALFRRKPLKTSFVEAPVVGSARVRNTGGVVAERLVIETTIRLGSTTKRIRLTVANRGLMLSPLAARRPGGEFWSMRFCRKYVLKLQRVASASRVFASLAEA